MALGLRLGFAQGLGADNVELHVVPVHPEVAPDQVGELLAPRPAVEE